MSFNDGSSRPRFMDTFKAALAPRAPISIDKDAPNPLPKTVKVSGGLSLAAGALTFGVGLLYIFNRQSSVQMALDQIAACKADGIGVGAAVTTTDTSDAITLCRTLIDPTADQVASALSSLLMTGIILVIVGAAVLFGGYGLLKGARWGRRVVTTLGALLLIGTMLGLFSHLLLLVAALLLLVALVMVYVGRGANYYIRAKAKGVK